MKKILTNIKSKAAMAAITMKSRIMSKAVDEAGVSEHTDKTAYVIIGLVIAALVLSIIYFLVNTSVRTGVTDAINDLFTYNGGATPAPTT